MRAPQQPVDPRPTRVLSLCLVSVCLLASARCSQNGANSSHQPATVRLSAAVVLRTWVQRGQHEAIRNTLARFTRDTGIAVDYVPALRWKPQRLNQYLEWLEKQTATPDVYEADITEVGSLAEHMIDLGPHVGDTPKSHSPDVIKHYVVDGRLVALPVHTDIGLLFYRKDLLNKYGFARPPETWTELEAMSAKAQAGERAAGNKDFWGLSWTASDSDDLLCIALECQVSFGGGAIIEADRTISVNNRHTINALETLRRFVGTISPPGVTAYGLEDARSLWDSGNAAFLMYWGFGYAASQAAPAIRGKVGVTLPPSGGAGRFGTLGGWQLSVSKYSKHPREAARLVMFLTGRSEQLERAMLRSNLPTMPELYDDPRVLDANPHFRGLKDVLLNRAVARPSTVAGEHYPQVAAAYSKAVHAVLTDRATAADALADLERQLVAMTGFKVRRPAGPSRAASR